MSTTLSFARTPEPPYYAVVFTSIRTDVDDGYAQTAGDMIALAGKQPGYLGEESVREPGGLGLTVSYWRTLEDVSSWKRHADHVAAQKAGREHWYRAYVVRICKVEKAYTFER